MAAEAPGRWCDYGLYFNWSHEISAMHFTCAFDLKVLRDVMRMRLGKTVAGVIRENIPDPNVAQMLDHFVQCLVAADLEIVL